MLFFGHLSRSSFRVGGAYTLSQLETDQSQPQVLGKQLKPICLLLQRPICRLNCIGGLRSQKIIKASLVREGGLQVGEFLTSCSYLLFCKRKLRNFLVTSFY